MIMIAFFLCSSLTFVKEEDPVTTADFMKTTKPLLDADELLDLQTEFMHRWDKGSPAEDPMLSSPTEGQSPDSELKTHMLANHGHNFRLWQLEDRVRCRDSPDHEIVDLKRQIDRENQLRHDAVESFDEVLLGLLQNLHRNTSTYHELPTFSETPGAILDRTSIINLKLFHLEKRADDPLQTAATRSLSARNSANLAIQLRDLGTCLREIISALERGERRLSIYYQFKMYQNPPPR